MHRKMADPINIVDIRECAGNEPQKKNLDPGISANLSRRAP